MITPYLIGNLLGRVLASYALVWLACLLAARGNWRGAFTQSKRWYSVLAVLLLTALGLAGSMVRSGGL